MKETELTYTMTYISYESSTKLLHETNVILKLTDLYID